MKGWNTLTAAVNDGTIGFMTAGMSSTTNGRMYVTIYGKDLKVLAQGYGATLDDAACDVAWRIAPEPELPELPMLQTEPELP